MTQLLRRILAQCATVRIADVPAPTYPINEETQHSVGDMSEDLRRLWGVLVEARDEYESILDEYEHNSQDAPADIFIERVRAAQSQLKLIKWLFRASVRFEFPETLNKEFVGVRSDWKVFWKANEPQFEIELTGGIILVPGLF